MKNIFLLCGAPVEGLPVPELGGELKQVCSKAPMRGQRVCKEHSTCIAHKSNDGDQPSPMLKTRAQVKEAKKKGLLSDSESGSESDSGEESSDDENSSRKRWHVGALLGCSGIEHTHTRICMYLLVSVCEC